MCVCVCVCARVCSRVLPECSQSAPECSRVLPECSRVLPSAPRVLTSAPKVLPECSQSAPSHLLCPPHIPQSWFLGPSRLQLLSRAVKGGAPPRQASQTLNALLLFLLLSRTRLAKPSSPNKPYIIPLQRVGAILFRSLIRHSTQL